MKYLFRSATLALLIIPGLASAQEIADTIYSGGPILTINDAAPIAEAVAVTNGRIIAVGSTGEVNAHKGDQTKMFNLDGKAMLPGFVDPHGHILLGGIQALSANLLPPPDGQGSDIASLQNILRGWIADNADVVDRVGVIVGFGYDNSQLAEQRHPTREDLDAVSADVPILLVHQSTHLGVLNSAALRAVGIDASTEDPDGGVIQREFDGKTPNGIVEEIAFFVLLPKLLEAVGQEGVEGFAAAGAKSWSTFGYTTAQEGRSIPQTAEIMRKVADEGGFDVDVVTYVDLTVGRDYIADNYSRDYRNRYRVAGAKMVIDGSPQGFTAWRDQPYYDPVGDYPDGYSGYASVQPEGFKESVLWTYKNDIPLIVHANGEQAGDLLIEALSEAQEQEGNDDRRPVLIHGQFERFDHIDKYKQLGVIPSLFPMHTFYWGVWHYEHTVGPELAQNISPTGWYQDASMIFTTHHDAPVALPDSIRVLAATVNRTTRSGRVLGPDQKVDINTALHAMTIWPAYQIFEEDSKGSIEVGKLADFVIL